MNNHRSRVTSQLVEVRRVFRPVVVLWVVVLTLLRCDVPPYADRAVYLDRLIAGKQFDLLGWWLRTVWDKWMYGLASPHLLLNESEQVALVRRYFQALGEYQHLEGRIRSLYAAPNVTDPYSASAVLRAQRDATRNWLSQHQSAVEAILEQQVAAVLREEGMDIGGEIYPPVRFRFSPLPHMLVISRRDRIERIDSRELSPSLPVDVQDQLERTVDQRFNVSSLVTNIGGLGAYPTMLVETPVMEWVIGTVAHEWTHNYLLAMLSPVALRYYADPAMRTINETTAVIVEREVGPRVIARFYRPSAAALVSDVRASRSAASFDFRAEMRATRLRVDALLAEGRVEEAEAYMEERRKLFVANGYPIRKLNQAWFAFHGAYNADPDGSPAAGADPIGPAVQALRQRSASLGNFLRQVASLRDKEDLFSRVR